jgi:hypothetical protein
MLRLLSSSVIAGTAVAGLIPRTNLWQPAVGVKWQIIISNNISVDTSVPLVPKNTPVWDIDLFNTPKDVFTSLHEQGKKIICYFSAGTGESWRPDYNQFLPSDLGDQLGCWPGEKFLNINSQNVWNIMANRIKMASDKGCDAIDPDDMGKSPISIRGKYSLTVMM